MLQSSRGYAGKRSPGRASHAPTKLVAEAPSEARQRNGGKQKATGLLALHR
jgi:hypothetical protein